MTDRARLIELARRAAMNAHDECFGVHSEHDFDACPHLDCAFIRSALREPAGTQEGPPQCPHGENCACAIMTRHEWHVGFCEKQEEFQQLAKEFSTLRAATAPQEWQAIETAPKDQTEILVLHGGEYLSVVWWDDSLGGWLVAALAEQSIYVEATHWMPLPAPPKGGGA